MNPRAAIARVSRMDAAEIGARLRAALRTNACRLRFAVAPPRWNRAHILDVLDPSSAPLVAEACASSTRGDYGGAHRLLAAHLRSRRSRWPLRASRREELTTAVRHAFPGIDVATRQQADRVLDGWLDVLGYRDLPVGNPPTWRHDPLHHRYAPQSYWADVPYLDPATGDHKVIWEINRQQYFLTLGTAYWLTEDNRYRRAFVRHIEEWLAENPPLAGINWASMLELAFRTISWTWAVEFFAASKDAEDDRSPWLIDLFVGLDAQLSHIASNLSTYFSPNTHLTGEALALYVVSAAFPELRRSGPRAALGRDVLLRESHRQVLGDGCHIELSTHYHRYSTDFYLLACMVARTGDDDAALTFERTAHRQAAYLRTIADDRGRLPQIGDDDGGRLFKFDDRPTWDASTTLSVAAALLSDPSLAVQPATAEVFWTLGARPEPPDLGRRPWPWPSCVLADSGYFVSRSAGGNHLVFDAGRHGYLNGGHAHSDALSIVLTVRGQPLLIDPGTATYTMDRAVRDRHRSARMHNTIVIDGRDPSTPAGPFRWRSRMDARMLVARTGRELDFAAGAIGGRGAAHVRAVVVMHGAGWLIVDRLVAGAPVTADLWWHLHPMWEVRASRHGVIVESRDRVRLGLAFSQGDLIVTRDPEIAAVSFEYGCREIGTAIQVQHCGTGAFAIACFIPETSVGSERLRIRETQDHASSKDGWSPVSFAIEHGTHELTAELYFPDDPEAEPGSWPQPCIRSGRAKEMAICAE